MPLTRVTLLMMLAYANYPQPYAKLLPLQTKYIDGRNLAELLAEHPDGLPIGRSL